MAQEASQDHQDEIPKKRKQDQTDWKKVLTGQISPTPMCYCNQPSVARVVVKKNENWGRRFYVCTKPAVRYVSPELPRASADAMLLLGRSRRPQCSLQLFPMGQFFSKIVKKTFQYNIHPTTHSTIRRYKHAQQFQLHCKGRRIKPLVR